MVLELVERDRFDRLGVLDIAGLRFLVLPDRFLILVQKWKSWEGSPWHRSFSLSVIETSLLSVICKQNNFEYLSPVHLNLVDIRQIFFSASRLLSLS